MAGPTGSDKSAQRSLSQSESQIATDQNARGGKMFDLAFPGMEKATDFYTQLASGDPNIIAKSIAPATEQISQQTNAAKARIEQQAPRGGEKRLATEMLDAQGAGERGRLATQSWLSSFPALASLGSNAMGLSNNQIATAISGNSAAMTGYNNVMKADAASKASQLGFMGSLADMGGQIAGAAIGGGKNNG